MSVVIRLTFRKSYTGDELQSNLRGERDIREEIKQLGLAGGRRDSGNLQSEIRITRRSTS